MTQSAARARPVADDTEIAEIAAVRSADFLAAAAAAGVMMAFADGEMAPAEHRRILRMVQESPMLSGFSHEQIASEIAAHEANYRMDPELAQILAREKVLPIVGQPRLARRVITLCRAIIPADGVAHPGEFRVLAEIAELLGIQDVVAASRRASLTGRYVPRAAKLES